MDYEPTKMSVVITRNADTGTVPGGDTSHCWRATLGRELTDFQLLKGEGEIPATAVLRVGDALKSGRVHGSVVVPEGIFSFAIERDPRRG